MIITGLVMCSQLGVFSWKVQRKFKALLLGSLLTKCSQTSFNSYKHDQHGFLTRQADISDVSNLPELFNFIYQGTKP